MKRSFTILLLFFLSISISIAQDAIIGEWSQGTGGAEEWVEIQILTNGTDLRGWDMGDNDDGSFSTAVTFTNDANWSNLNAGTLIVIYNGGDVSPNLPAADTDFSDDIVIIPSTNTTFFTDGSGGWPGSGVYANSDSDDQPALRDASNTLVHDVACSHGSPTIPGLGSGDAIYYIGSDASQLCNPDFWIETNDAGASPGVLNPLPVTLTDFYAKPMGNSEVAVQWITASEENNEYFSLEYSNDGRSFVEIAQINGAGTTFESQTYEYLHKEARSGQNYYRLRQVDFDGAFSYSDVQVVEIASTITVATITPTAARSEINLNLSTASSPNTLISVFNIQGQEVLNTQIQAGNSNLTIPVDGLQNGHYFLHLNDGQQAQTLRFVKF